MQQARARVSLFRAELPSHLTAETEVGYGHDTDGQDHMAQMIGQLCRYGTNKIFFMGWGNNLAENVDLWAI